MKWALLILSLIIMLPACKNNHVAHSKRGVQKRKYNKGYHLSLKNKKKQALPPKAFTQSVTARAYDNEPGIEKPSDLLSSKEESTAPIPVLDQTIPTRPASPSPSVSEEEKLNKLTEETQPVFDTQQAEINPQYAAGFSFFCGLFSWVILFMANFTPAVLILWVALILSAIVFGIIGLGDGANASAILGIILGGLLLIGLLGGLILGGIYALWNR